MKSELHDRAFWQRYLAARRGTYEYRTRRYRAVADELERLGLADGDQVVDVGAGMCEFGRYLYSRGWYGQYVAVDGSIDGTDLNRWMPHRADFFVAIEVLEHLNDPALKLGDMWACATKGVVITTPDTDVLGDAAVRSMDTTHIYPLYRHHLRSWGGQVKFGSFFSTMQDTLIGVFGPVPHDV